MTNLYDIFIIGGGINGAGIARDAAGRGLKVYLAEKGKIGSATSSWSTKLIHGGLRYLENYEFKLVRESLIERDIIHKIAPNITKSLPFVIPYNKKIRSKWLIKLGLFIYDHIGGKSNMHKSSTLNINKKFPDLFKDKYSIGFEYFDLQVDDKKLTEINIEDAKKNKAVVLENTKVVSAKRIFDKWSIKLDNNKRINAKILINASGPWVNEVIKNIIKIPSKKNIRLVKGSHIIVKKFHKYETAFTLQNFDNRIVFVIPYKDKFSLIGTTEIEVKSPEDPKINDQETEYLISCVNNYFQKQIKKSDIIQTYSGIRPLIEDYREASKITRDYVFDLNLEKNSLPLLNIFGGKLTSYRKLAEEALKDLNNFLPIYARKSWTSSKKIN
tara:strand:+ start:4004 stop:5158 length:1155 start_codon:yes stop_codon:yes gene_type:complete